VGTSLGSVYSHTYLYLIMVLQYKNDLKAKVSRACKSKGLSDPNQLAGIREAYFRKRCVDCEGKFVSGSKPGIGEIHRVRLHERSGTPKEPRLADTW